MHVEILQFIVVRAANADGDWVTVLTTPNIGVTMIDVDARGGNDVITISPSIAAPTTLRGGTGADIVRGGSGPNVIYGGRGPETEDSDGRGRSRVRPLGRGVK